MRGAKRGINVVGNWLMIVVLVGVGSVLALGCGKRDGGVEWLPSRIDVTEVGVGSKVGGRIKVIAVQEGSTVEQGKELATLDQDDLRAQLREAEAVERDAQARLRQAREAHALESKLAPARLRESEAAHRAASERLNLVRAGARRQEIEEARQTVAQATSRAGHAKTSLDRANRLFQKGAVTKEELDNAQTQFAIFTAQERAGKERLSLIESGARSEEVKQAEADVQRAAAAVEQARAAQDNLKLRAQDVAVADANVNRAAAVVSRLKTLLGETSIVSPISGIVLNKSIESGEVVPPGKIAFIVGDVTKPFVRIYLTEEQLGWVKLGQELTVKVDAFPKESFRGRVVWISSKAEFTPKNIQSKEERATNLVFAVKVAVDNSKGLLRGGMPAEAELRRPR